MSDLSLPASLLGPGFSAARADHATHTIAATIMSCLMGSLLPDAICTCAVYPCHRARVNRWCRICEEKEFTMDYTDQTDFGEIKRIRLPGHPPSFIRVIRFIRSIRCNHLPGVRGPAGGSAEALRTLRHGLPEFGVMTEHDAGAAGLHLAKAPEHVQRRVPVGHHPGGM